MRMINLNTNIQKIGQRFGFGIFSVSITRRIISVSCLVLMAVSIAAFAMLCLQPSTTAATCTSSPCSTTFQVNVKETLSVSITTPSSWASGNTGDFLRNKISVDVTSNNASGFTASMYSQKSSSAPSSAAETDLVNTAKTTITMPTLTSGSSYTCNGASCTSFPANYWGYSLDDDSNTGTYRPMVGSSISPITLISASAGTTTGSEDVYFGAKANTSQASGTYTGTVIISVVTGEINSNNPITPNHPATPSTDTTANDSYATYNSSVGGTNGSTVYTTTSSTSTTNTTTTQVSDGDVTSSYPLGETENTISNVTSGSSLATGLAATATAAAASGIFFFILAKRRKDDDEDEEEL